MEPSHSFFKMTCFSHGKYLKKENEDSTSLNSLTTFSSVCPQEMKLPGWEVAVLAVSFPPDVHSEENVWFRLQEYTYTDGEEDTITLLKKVGEEKTFHFNLLNYANTNDFLLDIAETIRIDTNISKKIVMGWSDATENTKKKISFKAIELEQNRVISFTCSHGFSKALGDTEPIGRKNLKSGDLFEFTYEAKISRALYPSTGLLFLLEDIIEKSDVDGKKKDLLCVIPMDVAKGDYLWEAEVPIYHALTGAAFSKLSFKIERPGGGEHDLISRAEFLKVSGGIGITLGFRHIDKQASYKHEVIGMGLV